MAVVSSSTSFPDLRAPPGYRIKRKPPPTIDISERYPSPDPQDPFAPLWVLRNRTGSSFRALCVPVRPPRAVWYTQPGDARQ
ncbi:hypothetical protein NLJ89_g8084 [Agrocybe chaxingu]|uniref:Uncharacterized protein n=1 Tax=Agrocybe chaxingu TaxID=84603 RepID=A0A9W8JVW7_9AGAR|nr:hypothetical protein NLJ89_g8084 [Agrocybe chaxingu]